MSRNIRFRPTPKQLEFFNRDTDYLWTGMQRGAVTDPIINLYRRELRMKGIIKNLINDRFFGFIRGENGMEYFFHRDDFSGHWLDLADDFRDGKVINVEFEVTKSPKGPRANKVSRLDFPNQAV